MNRPGLYKAAGCQPVYIKGRPNGGLGKEKQQIESQAKAIRSLVIKTLAIPTQLDVGLYLHRKGPY